MTKKELIEALKGYDDDCEIFGVVEAEETHNKSHVFQEVNVLKGKVQIDKLEEKPALYIELSD